MFSACDYFQQHRLRLNETAFLNGHKAIMLANGDVVMYKRNLVFDKKCNFECLMAESKVDGNMYLVANEMEPSFSSTVFTITRSEKDLKKGLPGENSGVPR